MTNEAKQFELKSNDVRLRVQEHKIAGQTVFRIAFSDRTPPLVITKAQHFEAHNFWTSIPEGRQNEAEEIGAVISNHLKSIV